MKRNYLLILSILTTLLLLPMAWAYDAEMAQGYARMFQSVHGVKAGKALHMVKSDEFVQRMKKGEVIVVIDIRTPGEFGVFGMTTPNTMTIPINELFKKENLERIPVDKQVLIVCKSGTRATAAGIALRHIGFENVYVLKGGLGALASYLSAKTANMPLLTAK